MFDVKAWAYRGLTLPLVNPVFGRGFDYFYEKGWVKEFVFPFQGTFEVEVENVKFKMASDGSDTVASRLRHQQSIPFEAEVFRVVKSLLPQINVFMDVGANTGPFSLFVQAARPESEVWAFEPVPRIHAWLKMNQKLNGFDRLHCEIAALSNESGETDFFVPKSLRIPTGGSLEGSHRPQTEKIPVTLTTLDQFVREQGITKVDLIKIDTESTEPAVIEGGLEVIRRDRPFLLVEVLQRPQGEKIEELLSGLEYSFAQVFPSGLRPVEKLEHGDQPQYWNFLLAPLERVP